MFYFGNTDVGMKRLINQDNYKTIPLWGNEAVLLVVCDGMGGHKAGDIASKVAIEIFCNTIFRIQPLSLTQECSVEQLITEIRYTMSHAADEANKEVYKLSNSDLNYAGMGTTIVAVLIYKGIAFILSAGDSRCYFIYNEKTKQVTHDHSYVQYLVNCGKITPEEAKNHPKKNVITQAIGVAPQVHCDIIVCRLSDYDYPYILLCTDGLSNYLDDGTLYDIIYPKTIDYTESKAGLAEKVTKLISHANNCGGADNITAVLCKTEKESN